jgi:hypothetical protein
MKNNSILNSYSLSPSSVSIETNNYVHENDIENTNTIVIEKKKRGRKKIIKPENVEENGNNANIVVENINVNENPKKDMKQRTSKTQKKEKKYNTDENENVNKLCDTTNNSNSEDYQTLIPPSSSMMNIVHKKRGRKPRGGKIIHENQIQKNNSPEVPNIILHLKCVLSDLKKSNEIHSNKLDAFTNGANSILCYNDDDQNSIFSSSKSKMTTYEKCDKNESHNNVSEEINYKKTSSASLNKAVYDPSSFYSKNEHQIFNILDSNVGAPCEKQVNVSGSGLEECNNATNKELWKKISQLKLNFHKNDSLSIQRSACFWDTCEFDTPPIHIPMSSTKGYGCFCHPQCAVAFLMNENIDTSTKFERYYLLNSIYGPIYNYNKSIKPAANPHYLLNKFYGNLTIHEYRKLFHSEQVVYIVNKPLTNVLPELYEDNNDFFVGNKIIHTNITELKNKNKTAKSSIINEVFGVK